MIGDTDAEAGLQENPASLSVEGDVTNDGMNGDSGKIECGHLPWPTADLCVWNEHWRYPNWRSSFRRLLLGSLSWGFFEWQCSLPCDILRRCVLYSSKNPGQLSKSSWMRSVIIIFWSPPSTHVVTRLVD